MHHGFEVGSVFAGLLQDPASFASTDLKTPQKPQARGPLSASEFRSVFDEAETTPFVPDGPRSPQDGQGGVRVGPNPEDGVFDLNDFFHALASGEIDLKGFVPGDAALKDQIRSMLATWSDQIGADPDLTSQTSWPNAMSPSDVTENLKAVAAALPAGSEVQKAVLALETLATQVQKQVSDAQQIAPWRAGSDGVIGPAAQLGALPSALTLDGMSQALPAAPGSSNLDANGFGDKGALAQMQSAPAPAALSSEVADGFDGPELTTAKGAASLFDPLPQSTAPAASDQAAKGLSALMKDGDDKGRFDALRPATNTLSSSHGGPDVYGPRSVAGWSSPVAPVSSSAVPFDAIPSEPFAMDGMPSDPAVETAAREARTPNSTVFGPQMPATAMAQAQPQQVVRQIAIAIQNRTSGSFEISLSPAELGSVRISLTTAETGMIVNIQAERQETLDLLRRNTDMLAEDFRDLGYDSTTFSFDGSDGQREGPGSQAAVITHKTDERHDLGTPMDADVRPDPSPILNDGSVDIRI